MIYLDDVSDLIANLETLKFQIESDINYAIDDASSVLIEKLLKEFKIK